MSSIQNLEQMLERYDEVSALLSDPAVIGDNTISQFSERT